MRPTDVAVYVVPESQKTLKWEGSLSGICYSDALSPEVSPLEPTEAVANVEIALGGATISVTGEYLFGGSGNAHNCDSRWDFGRRVVVDTGLGDSDVGDQGQEEYIPSNTCPGYHPYSADIDGSWSIEITAELCFEVTEGGWPDYGGTAVPDPPVESNLRYFWRASGTEESPGHLTVSCDAGGSSAEATSPIDESNRFEIGYSLSISPSAGSVRMAGNCEVTASFSEAALSSPGYSRTASGGSASASSSSFRASTIAGAPLEPHTAVLYATVAPVKSYDLRANVLKMSGGAAPVFYPEAVSLSLEGYTDGGTATDVETGGDGSLHVSHTQEQYWVRSDIDGTLDTPVEKNDWSAVRLWVRNGWLDTKGEDTGDWRVQLRGLSYPSFSASHANTVTLDDGASVTSAGPVDGAWEDVENTTLTQVTVGGESAIRIVVDGGLGKCRRTFDSPASMEGYRTLGFLVRSADVDEQVMRIAIGDKKWYVHTGDADTWVARYIDLCCPDNATASTDDTDSRFPLPTVDGPLWGVTAAEEIVFETLVDGVTYYVSEIRETGSPDGSYATLTFAPAFKAWVLASDESEVEVRRFLLGNTDGRQSLEAYDVSRLDTSYSILSINNLFDQFEATWVQEQHVWSATGELTFPDAFHTNDRPAVWAFGAGALFAPGGPQMGFGRDYKQSKLVRAQALWDQVDWPPGLGDVFELSLNPEPGRIYLGAVKIFRAQAHGLVFDEEQQPLPGEQIFVREVDGGDAGKALSGPDGSFHSGPPYGRGQREHEIEAFDTVTRLFHARKQERATFRQPPPIHVLGVDPDYFPFVSQFSDPQLIPFEEWRRIPPAPGAAEYRPDEWRGITGPTPLPTGQFHGFGADELAQSLQTAAPEAADPEDPDGSRGAE